MTAHSYNGRQIRKRIEYYFLDSAINTGIE